MKKAIIYTLVLMLCISLTACGKSEFGLSENDGRHMTITARNADRDAFFMAGSLEVNKDEQILITSDLKKGLIRVEIVAAPEEQSIVVLPDMEDMQKHWGKKPKLHQTFIYSRLCVSW